MTALLLILLAVPLAVGALIAFVIWSIGCAAPDKWRDR